MPDRQPTHSQKPPKAPAFLMGIGLGGFIDGILLHQVFQWHHMLTSTDGYPRDTVSGLEANTLADGFFHLSTWVFVAVAMTLTVKAWRAGRLAPPWRTHVGMLLAGWGAFNLVEGVIDHEILGIHHVRDDLGGPVGWDLGFLALGLLLVAAGLALARNSEREPAPQSAGSADCCSSNANSASMTRASPWPRSISSRSGQRQPRCSNG